MHQFQTSYSFEVFHNDAPMTLMIFCIDAKACEGDYSKNSLKFINPCFKYLAAEVSGQLYPTSKPKKKTGRVVFFLLE